MSRFVNLCIFWCLGPSWAALGVALPPKYKSMKKSSKVLAYVVLDINGRHQQVKNGASVPVSYADVFEIKSAVLNQGGEASAVNMVGFRNPKGHAADQGYQIQVRELESYWKLRDPKNSFQIIASTGDEIHGVVYISLASHAEIFSMRYRVNGEDRIVYPGEEITLRSSDQFKIVDVSSNLDHSEIEVNLSPKEKSVEGDSYHQEIIIKEQKHAIIARFGIKVQK